MGGMLQIRKKMSVLTNAYYNMPQTSLLTFQFEPHRFASVEERLERCGIERRIVGGKDVYVVDGFFREDEGGEVRGFCQSATFSRNSYGSPEAIEKGERPARSMNGKERWQFFSNPPAPFQDVFRLFATIAEGIGAEVSTLPWELCDKESNGSPSVIGNYLEMASVESMGHGKHKDCDPANGVAFEIPKLYADGVHASCFENGGEGLPWIVSVMVYATAENYLPEYRMGTAFYGQEEVFCTEPCHMRMVLFEADLDHTIEASQIPDEVKTWRVSYVFKLVFNPKSARQSMKKRFLEWIS